MLVTQSAPSREDRIISQPSTPTIPAPPERGFVDWGIALGVCAVAGSKLWGLFSQQQSADTKTQDMLISALVKQNEILLSALVEQRRS